MEEVLRLRLGLGLVDEERGFDSNVDESGIISLVPGSSAFLPSTPSFHEGSVGVLLLLIDSGSTSIVD